MKSLDDMNLRAIFRDTLRIPTLRAAHCISFRAPSAEEVSILGVKKDRPVMLLEANGYTYRDQPFSYQAFSIPTDLINARLLV
jgi:DNA-binding GntR family transcriptional regulator